jgi:hypothetical protein
MALSSSASMSMVSASLAKAALEGAKIVNGPSPAVETKAKMG